MLKKIIPLSILALAFASCENNEFESETTSELKTPEPIFRSMDNATQQIRIPENSHLKGVKSKTSGIEVSLFSAEYITSAESQEIGNIIIFNNRGNKMLTADFAPELSLDGTSDISYSIDRSRPSANLNVETTTAAIQRSMDTWDAVDCSDFGLYEREVIGSSGFYAALLNGLSPDEYGGSMSYTSDVNHAGWLPGSFFDFLAPNGSGSILGVTFTLIFTNGGVPIDSNNDGKADVAFREIYYNDAFLWGDGSLVDVESIALHEAGHGLSQAHFGKAFVTGLNGNNPRLQISPRAVMNAGYFGGTNTVIESTDNAGHCANWANWPNK